MKDDIMQLLEGKNVLTKVIADGNISASNMAYIYENDRNFVINPNSVWITEENIDFNNSSVIQYGIEVSKDDFFSLDEALIINNNTNQLHLYKPNYDNIGY